MNDNHAPQLSRSRAARCYRITWHAPNGLEGKTFATGLARTQRIIKLYTQLGYRYKAEIV